MDRLLVIDMGRDEERKGAGSARICMLLGRRRGVAVDFGVWSGCAWVWLGGCCFSEKIQEWERGRVEGADESLGGREELRRGRICSEGRTGICLMKGLDGDERLGLPPAADCGRDMDISSGSRS